MNASRYPIPAMPTMPLTSLLPRRQRALPAPFDDESVSFWFSARIALWQAARALGLQRGDTIAVPAFCCGSEIEPFEHAGLRLRFFGLNAKLDPDPESFSEALIGADAALVTHYFGFPASLKHARAECDARDVPLIEDCAHALYAKSSEGLVGTIGDASVFSFRKTIALSDGAALRVANPKVPITSEREAAPSKVVRGRMRRLVAHAFHSSSSAPLRLALRSAVASKHLLERRPPTVEQGVTEEATEELYEDIRFKPERSECNISASAERMFRATNHVGIERARRHNYAQIAPVVAEHESLRPLFEQLPAGASPLFFPIVVQNPFALREHMLTYRIGVKHIWPWFLEGIPWDDYPSEVELKRTVLGLPVHQCLGANELARIVTALGEWNGS